MTAGRGSRVRGLDRRSAATLLLGGVGLAAGAARAAGTALLNASYDPTRELYRDVNRAFAAAWERATGGRVVVHMSHGASGAQARAVIDGLDADVVTLASAAHVDAIAKETGKLPAGWQERLPGNSCPYTSTVVFVVRQGNPLAIRDWDDLARPGVKVITPNPKTSGGARWNYLAAWAWAQDHRGGDAGAREFVARLYRGVPVLDAGTRNATTTFAQRGFGDALITWENEAFLALDEFPEDRFEIVVPSESIQTEPPVALVDGNVDAKGTREAAEAYLGFLYTPEGQALAARHFYRPLHPEDADPADLARFPELALVTVDERFGGWAKAESVHFAAGGTFGQLYRPED